MWGNPHLSTNHTGIHTEGRAHLKSGPTVEPRETGIFPFPPTFSVPVSSLRPVPFMVADSGAVCFKGALICVQGTQVTTSALCQAHSCTGRGSGDSTRTGDTTTLEAHGSSVCSPPGAGLSLSWPTPRLPGSLSIR